MEEKVVDQMKQLVKKNEHGCVLTVILFPQYSMGCVLTADMHADHQLGGLNMFYCLYEQHPMTLVRMKPSIILDVFQPLISPWQSKPHHYLLKLQPLGEECPVLLVYSPEKRKVGCFVKSDTLSKMVPLQYVVGHAQTENFTKVVDMSIQLVTGQKKERETRALVTSSSFIDRMNQVFQAA